MGVTACDVLPSTPAYVYVTSPPSCKAWCTFIAEKPLKSGKKETEQRTETAFGFYLTDRDVRRNGVFLTKGNLFT